MNFKITSVFKSEEERDKTSCPTAENFAELASYIYDYNIKPFQNYDCLNGYKKIPEKLKEVLSPDKCACFWTSDKLGSENYVYVFTPRGVYADDGADYTVNEPYYINGADTNDND